MAIYVMFSDRSRMRITATVVGVAVPIAIIGIFMARDIRVVESLASRNLFVERVLYASLDSESHGLRVTGLRIAGQAFVARPITGWGGENFEVPYQRFQREGEVDETTPVLDRAHNKLLDLLATSGLIGFATYMAVWGWIGALAWRRVRAASDRLYPAAVAGAFVALFIHNLFLFDTAATLLMFALIAAWAAHAERAAPLFGRPGRLFSWEGKSVRRPAGFALTVVIGLALFVSIYGLNWRMYRGAQLLTRQVPP